MDYFDVHGVWWLPEDPAHRVPGRLTFDEDGLNLALHGSLLRPEETGPEVFFATREWTEHPRVLGNLDDFRNATVLHAAGDAVPGPADNVRESYRARTALLGESHARDDLFDSTWIEFDLLDAWSDPSRIDEPPRGLGADEELARLETELGTITLRSGPRGSTGPARIDLSRLTRFEVALREPRAASVILHDVVRPLRALLTVTLGRAPRHRGWWLRPVGAEEREDPARGYYEEIARRSQRHASEAAILSYTAPTILTARNPGIELGALIRNWFDVWSTHEEAIGRLLGPYYAPFLYSEHRYASLFQALEAFRHAYPVAFPTQELTTGAHRKRVDSVMAALDNADLDAEIVGWAKRVLQARNDRPLRSVVEDVTRALGPLGDAVLNVSPQFAALVVNSRTGVSHGGAKARLDAVGRHWYGELLLWIVRAHLLVAIGVPLDDVAQRVLANGAFQHAIEQATRESPAVDS